ncbi:hypothetical protein [Pantoea sp. USHLN298]|uniref:hypothetical protein n=1 Tax=Pantoea sp. USHLN298 TaxID=3081294 RepID=UPI00301727C5
MKARDAICKPSDVVVKPIFSNHSRIMACSKNLFFSSASSGVAHYFCLVMTLDVEVINEYWVERLFRLIARAFQEKAAQMK